MRIHRQWHVQDLILIVTHTRRVVGIVDDSPLTTTEGGQQPYGLVVDTDMDTRIVINAAMVDEAGSRKGGEGTKREGHRNSVGGSVKE